MFETRKGEVSEFTRRAVEDHVKEVCRLGGFSKSEVYRMLAGQAADRLDDARDIHRALCTCNPEAAEEYRNLLASDRDLVSAKAPTLAEGSDELEMKRLCDGLTTALHMDEEEKLSAMRRLHAYLSGRLKLYSATAHLRNVV
jgi:hypothetical protein